MRSLNEVHIKSFQNKLGFWKSLEIEEILDESRFLVPRDAICRGRNETGSII